MKASKNNRKGKNFKKNNKNVIIEEEKVNNEEIVHVENAKNNDKIKEEQNEDNTFNGDKNDHKEILEEAKAETIDTTNPFETNAMFNENIKNGLTSKLETEELIENINVVTLALENKKGMINLNNENKIEANYNFIESNSNNSEANRINSEIFKINKIENLNRMDISNEIENGISNGSNLTQKTNSTSMSIKQHKEDSIFIEAKDGMETQSEYGSRNNSSKFFYSANPDNSTIINIDDNEISQLNQLKENFKVIIEKANRYRTRANGLFKKNKFKDALDEFNKAVECVLTLKKEEEDAYPDIINANYIVWIKSECLNSMAVCSLLIKDYNKCLDYTQRVNKFIII